MKHISIVLLFSVAFALFAQAQSDCTPLKASDDGGVMDMLGKNKVNSVCILSENDEHVAIKVAYTGFSDKEYKVVARILNATKKTVKEFETLVIPVTKGGESVDLQFEFKPQPINYSKPTVDTKYVSIAFVNAKDPLSNLDFGGASLLGSNYTYKLDRKWRVGANGNSNPDAPPIVVKVKLTPFKTAKDIKP